MKSKHVLTIVLIFFYFSASSQKRQLDSLLTELKEHPAEDLKHLQILNALIPVQSNMNLKEALNVAAKAIELAKK